MQQQQQVPIVEQQQRLEQQQPQVRRLEIQVERDHSQTQLSLALSPVLTNGFYSESLSQSISSRSRSSCRRSTPPPAPLTPRDEGVVIQAGMSFVLGHKTVRSASVSAVTNQVHYSSTSSTGRRAHTGVKHHFRPLPAHTMADTTSSLLSRAIRDFLGRTDHVMNEWKSLGAGRSRSVGPSSSGRRYSMRSLSSSRYSSSDPSSAVGLSFDRLRPPYSRVPSFHSVHSSSADTDFGSCQDLNDYEELPLQVFF